METTTHKYRLISLLAENGPLQSWKACLIGSDRACFLKIVHANGSPDSQLAHEAMLESIRLQQLIRSRNILRARSALTLGGSLHVEYPYLAEADWQRLTPELFWKSPIHLLTEICFTLDYLHLLGIVHGDVKLDNFMVSTDLTAIRLIDLDFASLSGSRPRGRVFGSPDHIAPEILTNSVVLAQSDNFSLGFSLSEAHRWLDRHDGPAGVDAGSAEAVERFARTIGVADYLQRPFGLLDAAWQHGVITEGTYLQRQRQLLGNILLTRIGRMPQTAALSAERLNRKLRLQVGLFGVHSELLAAWLAVYRTAPRQALHMVNDFVSQVELRRFERFFTISCSDDAARQFLRTCDSLAGQQSVAVPVSLELALAQARRELADGSPLRAYLFLREADMAAAPNGPDGDFITRKRLLASLAMQLDRPKEAYEYWQQMLDFQASTHSLTADTIQETGFTALLAGMPTAAQNAVGRMKEVADASLESRLQVRRIEAWLLNQSGRIGEAEDLFQEILREAESAGLYRVADIARYGLAYICWRRGDLAKALELLRECVAEARKHKLLPHSVGVLSLLSSIYLSLGRYRSVLRCASYGLRVMTPDQAPTAGSLYITIMAACIRLSAFDRARYWLQEYQVCRSLGGYPSYFRMLAIYQGFVEQQAGNLVAAQAAFADAITPDASHPPDTYVGKAYQNLAVNWCWRGDRDKSHEAAGKARQIFERLGDRASLAEVGVHELVLEQGLSQADRSARWRELIRQLEDTDSIYYAVYAIFIALTESSLTVAETMSERIQHLLQLRSSRNVPLFSALQALTARGELTQLPPADQVTAWKRAFSRLYAGKEIYLAAVAAMATARQYESAGRLKHAHKYLLQAEHLWQTLGNDSMTEKVRRMRNEITAAPTFQSHMLDSFVRISELLGDLDNYSESLKRILEFAINQTGAERGILFLKRPDRRELVVGASENCDRTSLQELTDFSSNLPLLSADSQSPLLIADATRDQRTNKYPSVLRHNILSVACVPLWDKDSLRGVLYLDHHAIPGLFEAEDLRYLQSLANFLSLIIGASSSLRQLTLSNSYLQDLLGSGADGNQMITQDPTLRNLLAYLPQIARTTATVLLLGESGTGKEILADRIHRWSLRAKEPFVKVNCAALTPSLLESELFGIAKNVATGVAERKGKFAVAEGGTLFLDEIGDMPLELQSKILRVIEYQQYERVGSSTVQRADVRIVCATNKDLTQLQAEKKFRTDLFYRINTCTLTIPPLRERLEDIPLLIDHFLEKFLQVGKPPRFSLAAMDALFSYHWPGNVRQLRNLVERSCIMFPGQTVEAIHLPPEIADPAGQVATSKEAKEALERHRIQRTLRDNMGNQSKTARELGLSLASLRRKIAKYRL